MSSDIDFFQFSVLTAEPYSASSIQFPHAIKPQLAHTVNNESCFLTQAHIRVPNGMSGTE